MVFGVGGFQGIAGQGVEFIVALAVGHDARRMRMVVDGANLANFRHERGVGRLRPRERGRRQEKCNSNGKFHFVSLGLFHVRIIPDTPPANRKSVLYHSRLFCGFRIQCPSSGYTTNFDGTFCRCIAVKNSRLCV